jgi:hypothetical protein
MISGANRVGFGSDDSVRRAGGADPVDFVIASLVENAQEQKL